MTTRTGLARALSKKGLLGLQLMLWAALLLAAPVGNALARTCSCVKSCCQSTCGTCFLRPSCRSGCESTCFAECPDPSLDVAAFDPTASILSRDGRRLAISGPISCTAGARIQLLRVTVTQNGSLAEGQTHGTCTGADQRWETEIQVPGNGFVAGPAHACGVSLIENDAGLADTRQWCRDIVLEGDTD